MRTVILSIVLLSAIYAIQAANAPKKDEEDIYEDLLKDLLRDLGPPQPPSDVRRTESSKQYIKKTGLIARYRQLKYDAGMLIDALKEGCRFVLDDLITAVTKDELHPDREDSIDIAHLQQLVTNEEKLMEQLKVEKQKCEAIKMPARPTEGPGKIKEKQESEKRMNAEAIDDLLDALLGEKRAVSAPPSHAPEPPPSKQQQQQQQQQGDPKKEAMTIYNEQLSKTAVAEGTLKACVDVKLPEVKDKHVPNVPEYFKPARLKAPKLPTNIKTLDTLAITALSNTLKDFEQRVREEAKNCMEYYNRAKESKKLKPKEKRMLLPAGLEQQEPPKKVTSVVEEKARVPAQPPAQQAQQQQPLAPLQPKTPARPSVAAPTIQTSKPAGARSNLPMTGVDLHYAMASRYTELKTQMESDWRALNKCVEQMSELRGKWVVLGSSATFKDYSKPDGITKPQGLLTITELHSLSNEQVEEKVRALEQSAKDLSDEASKCQKANEEEQKEYMKQLKEKNVANKEELKKTLRVR